MRWLVLTFALFVALSLVACSPATNPEPTPTPTATPRPTVIPTPKPTPTPTPTYQLEVLEWHWSREYSFITVEGEVKNISGYRLENVMATVVFRTKDETYVKSADALIDYNPIMPGQTSPFTVITTDNPLIYWASLSFRFLMGGSISTKFR